MGFDTDQTSKCRGFWQAAGAGAGRLLECLQWCKAAENLSNGTT
jgi:hypothetical protein